MLSVLRARTEGRAESFAEVFNAHHRRTVRLAYLLTSDPDVAEDVVAEAFANVWVQWDKGRVDDVGPYLRRAVVNNIRSRHRRKVVAMREFERRSGDDRGVRTFDEDAADRDEIWQALQRLPERQRAAIVLRYYEDLSEADTADALGISVGTVKSQVSRGMSRLRELVTWDREGGPEDGLPVPGGDA